MAQVGISVEAQFKKAYTIMRRLVTDKHVVLRKSDDLEGGMVAMDANGLEEGEEAGTLQLREIIRCEQVISESRTLDLSSNEQTVSESRTNGP